MNGEGQAVAPTDDGAVPVLRRPRLDPPGPDDHKYTRGLVVVIGGAMPGAAALATLGAAHAGAGYVRLLGAARVEGLPHAVVQHAFRDPAELARELADARIGAVVVGPGLGADDAAREVVATALRSGRPLVIDADALGMCEAPLEVPAILTPHMGEFDRAFGGGGDPHERVLAAAWRMAAVVVLKGSTTLIAAPDGRMAISKPLPATLATAGTGDVLSGVCGTMLAQLRDPFDAACAAVWLHGRAARSVAGPLIADRLASRLGAAVKRCW